MDVVLLFGTDASAVTFDTWMGVMMYVIEIIIANYASKLDPRIMATLEYVVHAGDANLILAWVLMLLPGVSDQFDWMWTHSRDKEATAAFLRATGDAVEAILKRHATKPVSAVGFFNSVLYDFVWERRATWACI